MVIQFRNTKLMEQLGFLNFAFAFILCQRNIIIFINLLKDTQIQKSRYCIYFIPLYRVLHRIIKIWKYIEMSSMMLVLLDINLHKLFSKEIHVYHNIKPVSKATGNNI